MAEQNEFDTFSPNKDGSAVMPLHTVDLADSISDTGKFAYCALCAICLNKLFNNDGLFKTKVIDSLLEHLKQLEQVKSAICAIADGHGSDHAQPFVDALSKEAIIDSNNIIVVEDFIKLILKSGYYDSRMRVLTKHVAFLLRVSFESLEDGEERILHHLKEVEHQQTEEEMKEEKRAKRNRAAKRYFLIGLATVGGGALIGLTGGLAAPLVAAGAGAVIGGAGAAALGTATGIYVIGSLFGVAGAGLTGYKMKKRVGAIEQFEFMPIAESSQLHVTIAIAGWLTKDEGDFALPWATLAHSKEQYCLKWESSYLLAMGQAINKIIDSMMTAAAQEALKYTVLSGLLTAIAWPASLMALAGIIDNPWSVCLRRSEQVGHELANVLLSRQQGRRPVTLIGFSLGARVIYYCLEEMVKRKGCEGIIEDVYMFGAPVSADDKHWVKFSQVVAGKITNGYCKSDWLLKFLYRTSSVQFAIAGLHPVKWDDRRMCNIDLSDVVLGHTDYANKMDEILNIVGVRTKEAPKRITQLRLHPSWSKDSVRSPSSLSLGSMGRRTPSNEDGSPCKDSPSKVIDVAKQECKLKRLTNECGQEDVEFAEDAWDVILKSETENYTFDDESENRAKNVKEHSSKDSISDTESSSFIISASVSRDSCLEDSELSLATDIASDTTDDLSIVTAEEDSYIAAATDRLKLEEEKESASLESKIQEGKLSEIEGQMKMASSTDTEKPQIAWDSGISHEPEKPTIDWDLTK